MDTFDAQALQKKYEHWHKLHKQLEDAQKIWEEADALLNELEAYYQSEQWRKDYESDMMLECAEDMYSILSEDALWNALTSHHWQAIRWMRLGLNVIDKND